MTNIRKLLTVNQELSLDRQIIHQLRRCRSIMIFGLQEDNDKSKDRTEEEEKKTMDILEAVD